MKDIVLSLTSDGGPARIFVRHFEPRSPAPQAGILDQARRRAHENLIMNFKILLTVQRGLAGYDLLAYIRLTRKVFE